MLTVTRPAIMVKSLCNEFKIIIPLCFLIPFSYSTSTRNNNQHVRKEQNAATPPSLTSHRPPTHPKALRTAANAIDKSSTANSTSYTQHYISNNNGHTSRVHVNNAGRSTQGRLRPETRVINPPPNRVCTALPDKDKNELSQALFRFGVAIGQSAGLHVDARDLNTSIETQENAPEDPTGQSQATSHQRLLPKKRRRHKRKYPDSDTSSDSDEEGMSRKRHRKINGVLDRSGPPNRIVTAVPISDRTLPDVCAAPDIPPSFDEVPDALFEKTCQQLENENIDALESPFSIDILSSPEPRSSPKSPFSTSSSSMSDWSDFENDSAPKSSTTTNMHATTQADPVAISNANPPPNRVCSEVPQRDRLPNRIAQTGTTFETVRPVEINSDVLASGTNHSSGSAHYAPSSAIGRSRSIDSAPFETRVENGDVNYHHSNNLPSESLPNNRNRSLSDPVPFHQPSNVQKPHYYPAPTATGNQWSETIASAPEHQLSAMYQKHKHSATEYRRCDWASNPYSSSSSASEENRRNQVAEILTESRQIADYMSSSSPAGSPFSDHSGARSPASWLLSPSPVYPYEHIRSSCYPPVHASVESHWQTFHTATSLPPTCSTALPQHHHYGSSISRRVEGRPSSHTVHRPIPKFPDMSGHYQNVRSPVGTSVYM